jgi:hypothetical protein
MLNNLPKPVRGTPLQRFLLPMLALTSLALTGCGVMLNGQQPVTGLALSTSPISPTGTKAAGPNLLPSVNAPAVVDAAKAFLGTLSEKQRATAQVGLTSTLAAKWSNFPAAVVPRNGVYFRDLNSEQTAAALKVAKLALSPEGFNRFHEVRATDDAFGKSDEARNGPGGPGGRGGPGQDNSGGPGSTPSNGFGGPDSFGGPGGVKGPDGSPRGGGGGPGGGPGGFGGANLFGAGNYIIAFLGAPSKTAPWMLQLGGHHIAFNIYYKGKVGAATPYFVGAQPNVWKDGQGKVHAPLAPMRNAMYKLVHSLTSSQLTKAHLGASFSDVYVGPGRDGQVPPTREGVPVSELSSSSKKLAQQAIAAWTGDTAQASQYRKLYNGELAATKVAYSGATTVSQDGDYVRIDGPRVWIEFVCQGSDHYHTIWRDKATDYGAEFSF